MLSPAQAEEVRGLWTATLTILPASWRPGFILWNSLNKLLCPLFLLSGYESSYDLSFCWDGRFFSVNSPEILHINSFWQCELNPLYMWGHHVILMLCLWTLAPDEEKRDTRLTLIYRRLEEGDITKPFYIPTKSLLASSLNALQLVYPFK